MAATRGYDPSRALRHSVLLMRVWAGVSSGLGAVAALPLTFALFSGHTKFAFPGHVLYFGACAIVFAAPAVLYILLSIYVKKRQHWAIVAAIVTASFHDLCALIGLIALLLALPGVGPYIFVPGMGAVIFIVACSHLIWCLVRSFEALNLPIDDEVRGFEPLARDNRKPSESVL